MGSISVDQILVTPLKRLSLEGGDVMHAMKQSDTGYTGFGEAYFSLVKFGAVKGWKRHLQMTLNLVVPIGEVQFVLMDSVSLIREERIGDGYYARLTIPPGIWFGFQGVAGGFSEFLVLKSS